MPIDAKTSSWHRGLRRTRDGSHQRIANELGIAEDVARRYVKRGRALRYSLWVAPFAAAVGGGAEVSIVGPDGVELTGADAEMRYWRVQAR